MRSYPGLNSRRAEVSCLIEVALLEAARDGELSHIAFDPHQALRLDDVADVVEDDTGDSRRPPYRQHHGEEEYGRRDLERDQDGREVGKCDRNRVVVGLRSYSDWPWPR